MAIITMRVAKAMAVVGAVWSWSSSVGMGMVMVVAQQEDVVCYAANYNWTVWYGAVGCGGVGRWVGAGRWGAEQGGGGAGRGGAVPCGKERVGWGSWVHGAL